ncbi:hypothetical protein SISSUDRAFT_337812 [Sistotremastrum suecicum HHB10207 ss-3]|uniref:Uncharacterized protein n=1 Tax=Sistotremastrum suecicum HHB10207 ss-3 TaxID=1314776 RepID=A0A166IW17_9AGAM|nr:hypothetical protein SISSUDRAFT_337812 [Sistotremastrum suecicum HHB10207 ss-3]
MEEPMMAFSRSLARKQPINHRNQPNSRTRSTSESDPLRPIASISSNFYFLAFLGKILVPELGRWMFALGYLGAGTILSLCLTSELRRSTVLAVHACSVRLNSLYLESSVHHVSFISFWEDNLPCCGGPTCVALQRQSINFSDNFFDGVKRFKVLLLVTNKGKHNIHEPSTLEDKLVSSNTNDQADRQPLSTKKGL